MSVPPPVQPAALVRVENLELRYGDTLVQRDINFTVNRGDIFIIMGGSGCGKSTLLRALTGLLPPAAGRVWYGETSLWESAPDARRALMRRFGVLYQQGALWSSLTLAENVAVPLETYTELPPATIRDIAAWKLALVGLAGCEDRYPSEISGGMRKRAGLARALALDPAILYFDEPSAGLDPLSSRLLDDLILELRAALEATFVLVTHELASIFAVGNNAVFLDAETHTPIASGDPKNLKDHAAEPRVRQFLARAPAPAGDSP